MKRVALGVLIGVLVCAATAAAGSRYLITSSKQIKPSVIKAIVGHTPVAPVEYIDGPVTPVAPGEVASAEAKCPPYSHALSGSGYASIAGIDALVVDEGGAGIIISNKSSITLEIHASAVCAPLGGAVVASHRDRLHAKLAAELAKLR